MELNTIIFIIVIVLLAFLILRRVTPVKGVHQMTTAELHERLKQKDRTTQWVDVRTPAEYRANHLKKFKNIPLAEISEKANGLNKDADIVLICRSGSRSMSACKQLKKLGFTRVYNVNGGMNQV